MAKRKQKFNSLSTPGLRQDLSNYLVELAFLKDNRGIRLPAKFWQNPRYKFRYMREIKGVRKFIKDYGEPIVLEIALKNHITTWTKYDNLHVMAQKIKVRGERRLAPKDTSQVAQEIESKGIDLRDKKVNRPRKKGLFEMILELEKNAKS
tara:strand:+ start:559 stop:1008 length:450 start_codon:yes stop_codon:yes gene_type:complete